MPGTSSTYLRWGTLFTASVALLLLAGVSSSVAEVGPPERMEIKLRFATFDPLVDGPPEVPFGLEAPAGADAYIVQFWSAPTDEDRGHLTHLGATVHHYLPDQAHVVRMDEQARAAAEDLDRVRWIGPYHPAFKLEEVLVERLEREPPVIESAREPEDTEQRYSIMVLQRGAEGQQAVADRIARAPEGRGQVHLTSEQGYRLEATLDDEGLRDVVGMGEILFVDRWFEPEADMAVVRQIDGADAVESAVGYTGEGVRGEVVDTRLRTTHQDFQQIPPIIHGNNDEATEGCGGNGHGHCSYGVIFGDGSGDADARGMLPDGQGIFSGGFSFVGDRYTHTAELVDPDDEYRAVFQSNSWGSGLTTDYTTISAELDDVVFLKDLLVTQSQSNQGSQSSRPQAWAKNVVSVGGILHHNSLDVGVHEWAGQASIGPAADGRIKPDLSHFYHLVYTTGGVADDDYRNYGGTSAATPITAGHFGLFFEMWADGVFHGGPGAGGDVFDSRPGAATAKAVMINTANEYEFDGDDHDLTRVHQGWGRANVDTMYHLARQHAWQLPVLVDESDPITDGEAHAHTVEVGAPDCTVRATMAYTDPMGNPAATEHRVNDLTLRLESPSGTEYWGNNGLDEGNWSTPGGSANSIDNVENVFLEDAELGEWTIEVLGHEIVEDAHPDTPATDAAYALVVTTCAETDSEVVDVAVVDPPEEIYTDEDVAVTVQAEVANHGPGGPSPADFHVTLDALAPAGCLVVGAQQVVVPVTLDVGETTDVDVAFDLRCTEPGVHTFDFDAEIASVEPDVRDPDPANNRAGTELTLDAIRRVDTTVSAVGVDVDGLRAVVAPVEPGEPMDGLGPLAAPWDGAGERPLPWAGTANPEPTVADCTDAASALPQPGHGSWDNPRTPITLVVGDPGAPASLFVDALTCVSHDVDVDTTVTATVVAGDCALDGSSGSSWAQDGAPEAGWSLLDQTVTLPDDLTVPDGGCTLGIAVEHEPADEHHELVGNPQGSVEVELIAARDGRMTGGGTVADGQGLSHGMQLRCDGTGPATLQITGDGDRFHLETVTAVLCFDDPAVDGPGSAADFTTLVGTGTGRLNGTSGAPVSFHFVDAGEPGTEGDVAGFAVTGGPAALGTLGGGNHRAHPPTGGRGPQGPGP